ncbi:MAG: glutamate synthase subunit beta [Kiritimatiellae bacterium]|nr:glutamate synthase subunit beta [Kiritimatiellia bacterium]
MGKPGGFLEHGRQGPAYRPAEERTRDFKAVEIPLAPEALRLQLARCQECGTPFCHGVGCPLANVIPELNNLAWQERWEEALALLLANNPFPEFTGRLCPALCEASCVLGIHDEAVTIRQIELAVIERGFDQGYLRPAPPPARFVERIAVVGSGPAGLAVADALNKAGYPVVVYEHAAKIGGILRYGIPDFKLEKGVLDRRIHLMEDEGVRFETGVAVGTDLSFRYLQSRYQAICLCGGAREPRDLQVSGRDLAGIHFAMDYLMAQNLKHSGGHVNAAEDIDARGKKVVIIGGGDTGADCLGTAIRQGAQSVMQVEILPEPPGARPAHTPWPMWPAMRRDSTSHKEGGIRRWGVSATRFRGLKDAVSRIDCVEVRSVRHADGRLEFVPLSGTEFELEADLVLLALGFVSSDRQGFMKELALERSAQGTIKADDDHQTSVPGVFVAGDMRNGPALVARAIADGLSAARGIRRWIKKAVGGKAKVEGGSEKKVESVWGE